MPYFFETNTWIKYIPVISRVADLALVDWDAEIPYK